MPREEKFLSFQRGAEVVEVLKTYDEAFAQEAFRNMDESAIAHLAETLKVDTLYEADCIPKPTDEGYEEFIWSVLVDEAREEYNTFSWFVVIRNVGESRNALFVSPDWPSSEAFANKLRDA